MGTSRCAISAQSLLLRETKRVEVCHSEKGLDSWLTCLTVFFIDRNDFRELYDFPAVVRQKRATTMRFLRFFSGFILAACLFCTLAGAQMYDYEEAYPTQRGGWPEEAAAEYYSPRPRPQPQLQPAHPNTGNPHYGDRILQEQVARQMAHARAQQPQHEMYDLYGEESKPSEGQLRQVLAEAGYVGSLLKKKNGKPFIVIDKRNFQFYLYDMQGRLLRIGPVAIGKGATRVGSFETPVGVYPIKRKEPVADWIRPDWYFIEEGEPIPKNWEDRRVPGFFRYKLVVDGSRYIHYAEATGGRLTHGCLGLDWPDAEAVFHTLEVGSYCVVIDTKFVARLAKGEFPIRKPKQEKKPEGPSLAANRESSKLPDKGAVFGSMW